MNVYLEEYSSDEAIQRYTSRTAGNGISYLLEHDYAIIYHRALNDYLQVPADLRLRLLEFGCGGGMNIITILSNLELQGRFIEAAFGTDFSERLINAANAEAKLLLTDEQRKKLQFVVGRNEELVSDLVESLGAPRADLKKSFHLVLGVNTFRYCFRLGKALECARGIEDLLAPGGICIMIDMNNRFPAFRSKLRDLRTKPESERYIPSLEEYTAPFI